MFFNQVTTTLLDNKKLLEGKISDKDRKTILDGLGTAGSVYRNTIYVMDLQAIKKKFQKNRYRHLSMCRCCI